MKDTLTPEEQNIHDLAKAHHAEQGRELSIDYLVGYAINGSRQNCVYMVMGSAVGGVCEGCGQRHAKSECMLLLRIGNGFVVLVTGEIKDVEGNIPSILSRFFGEEGNNDAATTR